MKFPMIQMGGFEYVQVRTHICTFGYKMIQVCSHYIHLKTGCIHVYNAYTCLCMCIQFVGVNIWRHACSATLTAVRAALLLRHGPQERRRRRRKAICMAFASRTWPSSEGMAVSHAPAGVSPRSATTRGRENRSCEYASRRAASHGASRPNSCPLRRGRAGFREVASKLGKPTILPLAGACEHPRPVAESC